MLHPVPIFHGFHDLELGQLGRAHRSRISLQDVQDPACLSTNTTDCFNIVEYLEEQAENNNTTTTTTNTNTSTHARGTPVERSVNEQSGLLQLERSSGTTSSSLTGFSNSDMSDEALHTNAAGPAKASPMLMGSPFAGNTYGLGIHTSSEASTSTGKPPSSGKASSNASSAPTRPWTAEEDEALRGVMRTTPGRSWPEISKRAFPKGERNKHECCARWRVLSTPKATKGPWTSEEDNLLLDLVDECGAEKWVIIATKIQTRSGKQCRERWHNHLDPAIKKSPFTAEEDETIWKLYSQWGSKWAEIAKHLPGRPDNMIKNHFNTSVQRNKRKQRARAVAAAEHDLSAEGESSTLPSIGLSSALRQEDFGADDPSSSTSASIVDSHGNPVGGSATGGTGGQPSASGSATTYIKVARDRYLPYRRPLPRPSLLHNQHSSSSSSAGLGSPLIPSPNTPLSPYMSMQTPNSATTSATSPISFSSNNSTSYVRQPLSASLPPSASSGSFMLHGPPGSAGGYTSPSLPPGSFRYPTVRGYSDSSPAITPHEFSPPLPGLPHYSSYPQYSHARTQQGSPPSGGVMFGQPRTSHNSHYQAYYPNSPISGSYTQHLPIPGSNAPASGSVPMSLSRSLPANFSNPGSPALQPDAGSPAMSDSAVIRSGQASAAVSPAMSPVALKVEGQETQSYFQQQQQKMLLFPVQAQAGSRHQSPAGQYSPQIQGDISQSVSTGTATQEETPGAAEIEKEGMGKISFRRIPGSITQNQEVGAMEFDGNESYAAPRSARALSGQVSPGSPASTTSASTAQQQVSQLSPLLPQIVTQRGSITGLGSARPPFLHASSTPTFLSPSTERLSIHTSISPPTLSPHLSPIPPASAPPTTTSMVGHPGPAAASAESSMSPQQYHHHHPHSPYYYTQQSQQGFPGLSADAVYRSEMQQSWQQRHASPMPEMIRGLPSPLHITANYEDEQRPDEDDRRHEDRQLPHSPYVVPASTLMSASTSINTVTSTSTAAAELSSPASSSLVTPPQQHEERLPSIHLQYEGHEGASGLDKHAASHRDLETGYNDSYDDSKGQSTWQDAQTIEEETPEMTHRGYETITEAYDQNME